MSPELSSIVRECAVPQAFIDWMVVTKIFQVEDFVWAASNDPKNVNEDVIVASGVQNLTTTTKITIRKAWWLAQLQMTKKGENMKSTAPVDQNAIIKDEDSKTLHDAFFRQHSFRLGPRRMLNDILQGRLLREYQNDPKTFNVILPEQLILRSAVGPKNVGTNLFFAPGLPATGTDVLVDNVNDSIELWKRIRGLVMTLSFISIQKPDWLGYMVGDEFCDKILDWMNTKYDGRRPPLSFYLQAYVSTFS